MICFMKLPFPLSLMNILTFNGYFLNICVVWNSCVFALRPDKLLHL